MEDTKVLLDENTHNVRHTRWLFFNQQFSNGSYKRSKLRLIMSKLLAGTPEPTKSPPRSSSNASQYSDHSSQNHSRIFELLLATWAFISVIFIILYFLSRATYNSSLIKNKTPTGLVSTSGDASYADDILLTYNTNIRWIVSSNKCHIPNIDPWHQNVKEYAEVSKPINCGVFDNDRALTFVRDNKLHFSNYDSKDYSDCCYRRLMRDNDDKHVKLGETCKPIRSDGMVIEYEHVTVTCSKLNYTSVHTFVQAEPAWEDKLKKLAEKSIHRDAYYNVLFFGMDTMSRLNMYRQMNETLRVLGTEYNMLEFLGYSKVGENTFPNLVPVLTGQSPEQLAKGCWNTTYENESTDEVLDNCDFLWNTFGRYGYRTLYHEDWPEAATFNYLKPGFKAQPTLFYARPWHLQANKYGIFHSTNGKSNCHDCIHNKVAVEVYLNHLKDYIRKYENEPYFAFHWINCPQHDDINGASRVDKYFAEFFRQIKQLVDERTFVIFFSDHGYRWGSFLDTYMGHQEASMPYLSMSVPKHFEKKHPDLLEHLEQARNTLITPFDLYQTVLDMLSLGLKGNKTDAGNPFKYDQDLNNNLVTLKNKNSTSFSILRSALSYSTIRGCDEAGIPDNYCVCNTFVDVSTNSSIVFASAWFLVDHINRQLRREEKKCAHLTLSSLLSAKEYRVVTTNANIKKSEPTVEYEVKIETIPGGALFQEVVRVYGDLETCNSAIAKTKNGDTYSWINDKFKMKRLKKACKFSIHSQSISRLNLYGNQSECLTNSNAELKKMCYCKKFLTNSTTDTNNYQ